MCCALSELVLKMSLVRAVKLPSAAGSSSLSTCPNLELEVVIDRFLCEAQFVWKVIGVEFEGSVDMVFARQQLLKGTRAGRTLDPSDAIRKR